MWWNSSESFWRTDNASSFSFLSRASSCQWSVIEISIFRTRNLRDDFSYSYFLGNASLISEALRHYQRLEHQNGGGETSTKKLDKQHRRHYQHVNECKFRPLVIEHAVTHKIQVSTIIFIDWNLSWWKTALTATKENLPEAQMGWSNSEERRTKDTRKHQLWLNVFLSYSNEKI